MFKKSSKNAYFDSCPECDSLNVRIVGEISPESETSLIECRDCGCDWEDWVE